MLIHFRHTRSLLPRQLRLATASQTCRYGTRLATAYKGLLNAEHEAAEELEKLNIWSSKHLRSSVNRADKHRIHIVSEDLCDDVMQYLAPSLQRHQGCDLIDINPGCGVWSRKLHEVVKPRKHILMDKDAKHYAHLLSDLTSKDGVEVVPKSGIFWKDLNDMLHDHMSHQPAIPAGSEPQRNDTVLVNLNLSYYPPKSFSKFECVSQLVMYQLMSSLRTSSLFQRYGVVRMLVWINNDLKLRSIPRTLNQRKRATVEAQLGCEWIHEIAGADDKPKPMELRDSWLDVESCYQVIKRMKKDGITPPPGRETRLYKFLLDAPHGHRRIFAGRKPPFLERPFRQELLDAEAKYEADLASGKITAKTRIPPRLGNLRYRHEYDLRDSKTYLSLLQQRDKALKMQLDSPQFAAADKKINDQIGVLQKNQYQEFLRIRDNYHVFRQDPPVLAWDQRPFEPLIVEPTDFYPNVPCALLDFQPRTVHPLLRQSGAGSHRSADISDAMLRFWFANTSHRVSKAMNDIWPGFGDLMTECKTLMDPALGGSPFTGDGELLTRVINVNQWEEILEKFMDWPFRPTYAELIKRLADGPEVEEFYEDYRSSAQGSAL